MAMWFTSLASLRQPMGLLFASPHDASILICITKITRLLTVLRSVTLLTVPYRSLAVAWGTHLRVTRLVSPALASLRSR